MKIRENEEMQNNGPEGFCGGKEGTCHRCASSLLIHDRVFGEAYPPQGRPACRGEPGTTAKGIANNTRKIKRNPFHRGWDGYGGKGCAAQKSHGAYTTD